MAKITAGTDSHVGDRRNNEDRAGALAGGRVFFVADGMGGQAGGERASGVAAESVAEQAGHLSAAPEDGNVFTALFRSINARLMEQVRQDPQLLGMGTTLTLGVLHGQQLRFAHVGDSRLYHWRAGVVSQLTQDHTQAQELVERGVLTEQAALRSRHRNVLTRFLGTANQVDPQLGELDVAPGDRLLCCSDGLHGALTNTDISAGLGATAAVDELASDLVQQSRCRGRKPLDNITAVVVQIDD